MLSFEALAWLKSVGYGEKNHEERMALIKAAKILFPSDDDDGTEENNSNIEKR